MIVLPFLYFSLLSFGLYHRRKQLDITILITLMFAICGAFSILVDLYDLRYPDFTSYSISPWAAIFYCGLITLNLLPFINYSNLSIKNVRPVRNGSVLKVLAVISSLWFFVVVLVSFPFLFIVLTSDIAELRHDVYTEDTITYMEFLPTAVRLPLAILNLTFGCYWVFIFLAFYSYFIQKLPFKYFLLFIFASLSGPWNGILGVDRSKTVYWIISLSVNYLLFLPYMTKKIKKRMMYMMSVLVGLAIVYVSMVTVARFGDRTYGHDVSDEVSGTEGGIISYLGQNFIYFCYYFDNFDSPLKTPAIILPFTYKYLLGDEMVSAVVIQDYITSKTGVFTGVFSTYLGQILICAGHFLMLLFCIMYTFISLIVINTIKKKKASLLSLLIYMTLLSVIYLGLFTHYYTSAETTFSLIVFLLLAKIMGSKKAAYG